MQTKHLNTSALELKLDNTSGMKFSGYASKFDGVDRYGDTLVAQFTSAGVDKWKDVIADALLAATGLTKLYERSDASVRVSASHTTVEWT